MRRLTTTFLTLTSLVFIATQGLIVVLLGVIALTVAACGKDSDSSNAGGDNAAAQTSSRNDAGRRSADFQKGYDAYYIARDYAAALREWKPLAEQGNADAQYYLGHMYRQGEGVPENDSAAAKWFTHAAQQGHANAQFYLSVMYYYGQGVDQDNVYAYMWWNIALSQGNPNAMDWRGIMEKRMTPSQIEKAEAFARECVSKNYKGC